MDFRQLFLAQHARAHTKAVADPKLSLQDYLLNDVSEAQMRERPPGFNSLAWNFWHMTRGEDMGVNLVIAGRPQLLTEDGWSDRLGVTRIDVATGMSDEEVDEFSQQVDIDALLAYRAAVGRQTQTILKDMSPSLLDETIDDELIGRLQAAGAFSAELEWVPERWRGQQKAFTLGHTVLGHTYIHIGQCEDIRAMLGIRVL